MRYAIDESRKKKEALEKFALSLWKFLNLVENLSEKTMNVLEMPTSNHSLSLTTQE